MKTNFEIFEGSEKNAVLTFFGHSGNAILCDGVIYSTWDGSIVSDGLKFRKNINVPRGFKTSFRNQYNVIKSFFNL